jgi:YebC/PmpR family DNA-binding regulatory protein
LHGVAVFVECLSDNNKRTVSSVRSVFNKYHGHLGTNGSLNFIFERKGIFEIKPGELDLDELELELIDGGAEEIFGEGEEILSVTCALDDFGNLNKRLVGMGVDVVSAELRRIPNETKTLSLEDSKKALRMIEALEEDDDVQNVFHNLAMTEELHHALEKE